MSIKLLGSDIFSNLENMNAIKLGDGNLNKSEEKKLRKLLVDENSKFLEDINRQLPDIDLTPLIKSKELHNFIMNIAIYIVYNFYK